MQCRTNVEDVGPTLHKWHTNVLRLLGRRTFSQTLYIYLMLVQCWASVADVGLTLKQHWINVSFEQYLVISSVAILMPSICTQYATVGLHLTVPGMRVLKLNDSLMPYLQVIMPILPLPALMHSLCYAHSSVTLVQQTGQLAVHE